MKRIITLSVAILCVALVAVLFYGCGNNAEDMTTTTITTTENMTLDTTDIVTLPDASDGVVSDVSGENENGLLGDIVTDVSEGVSEGAADMRNAMR